MIKRMRRNFILIAMASMLTLLLAILITINLFMQNQASSQVNGFLALAMENDGRIAPEESNQGFKGGPPNQMLQIPVVESASFILSSEGKLLEVIHNSEEMPEQSMLRYGEAIIERSLDTGSLHGYRYSTKAVEEGWIIVLANTSLQDDLLKSLLKISYVISGISVVVLFIFIVFMSKYITRPVALAFKKQKRFIADSSHELKTPLSVMSANLDMLQMEIGDNERISAMGQGIRRMNGLIHELLTLVRTEQNERVFAEFNLGEMMEGVILPLEVIAYEDGNTIEYQLEEDVTINGDEESLRKMLGALMENAVKYSVKDTVIRAGMYTKGHQAVIEVFNEGEGVTREQKEKLFDKFYRADDSRQRATGGYGIGLSIVKSVVDLHKGRIAVDSVPGESILFRVTLPMR